jgi:DMSO/TMAO reductase YedYZ molybdopterin-dependent catalytic subunit
VDPALRLRPPEVGPFRADAFRSPARSERTAAILGIALGACFAVCFATGLYSHLAQDPTSWFHLPARPAGLYRVTQGLHVATGIASIPLLLAKLWTVYPKLFAWPPFADVASAIERVALLPLVGGAVFLLFTGIANINLWYPWPFNFRAAHYWVAWITVGALVVHVGAKIGTTRRALRRGDGPPAPEPGAAGDGVTRRQLLGIAFGTSGLLTLFTVGQTVFPLRKLALLAPRRPGDGPQGFPVNRTAREADVVETAQDPGFTLEIAGKVANPVRLGLDEVRALPHRRATLPIACVEGWSANRTWDGIPLRDLLARAGVDEPRAVRVESLQPRRAYRTSYVGAEQVADRDTMLATRVQGEPLALDHGYPLRLIGPNRPGVLQTKWVTRVVVL